VVIELDPGRAFGTGMHASTRLCLLALEREADAGAPVGSVLDVGTGSGILAMAAQGLFPAARVVGIDNDPEAVEVARENVEKAHAAGRGASRVPELLGTPLPEMPGRFDVVTANLSAPVLTQNCDALVARLAPHGLLVASGILVTEVADVEATLLEAGHRAGLPLSPTRSLVEGVEPGSPDLEWAGLQLRARPPA
jgi:ribosomal protein L11 methyltransferase